MSAIAVVLLLLFSAPLAAQVTVGGNSSVKGSITTGGPVISGLTESADANSVVLTWTTDVVSTTYAYCGSQGSLYDGAQNSVTSHSIPVPQLSPSTVYTCYACSSGSCQSIGATTTANPTSTPITGVSLGAVTNYNTGAAFPMEGDAFWNAVGSDGSTYIASGDGNGWNANYSCVYANFVGKAASLSPINVTNSNLFTAWPGCSIYNSAQNLEYPHTTGIFSLAGKLFIATAYQQSCAAGFASCIWFYDSMRYSTDRGATWNSQSDPSTFNAVPALNSPWNISMWPNGPPYFSDTNFLMYAADDGTLGYSVSGNRVQNANAYVYGFSNALTFLPPGSNLGQGASAAGDDLYLWRVPRAQMADLLPSEYQFYIGGDGTQATAWSNRQTAAVSILHNDCNAANLPRVPGCMGNPSIVYISALNRYLLCTYYWTNGVNSPANTTWLFFEAPAPWGTWTQIGSMTFTNGAYDPIVLQADAISATFTGTQMRVLFAENWNTSNQNLFYATLTVNH